MCKSNEEDDKWVLIGINSMRTTSVCVDSVTMFTRVTAFDEWLKDQVDANGGPRGN